MNHYDEIILNHYQNVAQEDRDSHLSTMKDAYIRERETSLILQFVNDYISNVGDLNGIVIADIGCGNGYTLSVLSSEFPNLKFIGYEYTPELRQVAIDRFKNNNNVEIKAADIRNEFSDIKHDLCIVQRVIINLLDIDHQSIAVENVCSTLKKNGNILFIESFKNGLDELNEARSEFELPEIKSAYHNLLLNDDFFQWTKELSGCKISNYESNFLSSYYYIARVLHPHLLGDIKFKRNSHFVKYMSQNITLDYGNYSPIQAYAFTSQK